MFKNVKKITFFCHCFSSPFIFKRRISLAHSSSFRKSVFVIFVVPQLWYELKKWRIKHKKVDFLGNSNLCPLEPKSLRLPVTEIKTSYNMKIKLLNTFKASYIDTLYTDTMEGSGQQKTKRMFPFNQMSNSSPYRL